MPPLALLVWLGAYLVGAIPFGYLAARRRGVDIFKAGSGNIGATNVGRVLGKRLGILVFLLDVAKGALAVTAALAVKKEIPSEGWLGSGWLEVGAGWAAFLGHLFPVYLGFRGGKGVATGAGVAAMLVPGPALAAALAWVVVASATCYVSLASLAAAAVLCALQLAVAGADTDPRTVFCLVAGALVFFKHRSNVARLVRGTENRIRWGDAMRRVVHVLPLGLWFGSAVFFTFVVGLSLAHTFEDLGQKEKRPAWFPLPERFARTSAIFDGPKEQGMRAFGYAVGPLFRWYFLLQGLCGLISAWTALAWSRAYPRAQVHRWRAILLLLAVATVLAGWPLEQKVAELRKPRNQATEAYLQADERTSRAALEEMTAARAEFGRWHFYSLMLNFVTVLLVSGGMALAGALPAGNGQAPSRSQAEREGA